MTAVQVIKGIATYIPGLYKLMRQKNTGGSTTARYCYEVWIKHLTFLGQSGLTEIPGSVAELGPGDTIGVGLCALLSGSERYTALDVYPYASVQENLHCLDELIQLFQSRTPCAGPSWPDYQQFLDDRSFPGHILTDQILDRALRPERIQKIREQISSAAEPSKPSDKNGPIIDYIVPWHEKQNIRPDSTDLIISQSVLEHVVDIDEAIEACKLWARSGSWMSHQVDFTSHGHTTEWNGHWAISDFLWRLIVGRRQFFINREPVSTLDAAFEKNGFREIFRRQRNKKPSINRSKLATRFRGMSNSDFECAELLIQLKL